jgi:hypothetical protein
MANRYVWSFVVQCHEEFTPANSIAFPVAVPATIVVSACWLMPENAARF